MTESTPDIPSKRQENEGLMPKFRRKVEYVEAEQYTGKRYYHPTEQLPSVPDGVEFGERANAELWPYVWTTEYGRVWLNPGNWIINENGFVKVFSDEGFKVDFEPA